MAQAAKKKKPFAYSKEHNEKKYHEQRIRAEETGDQKTVDKIYGKLGKKSHSVDSNAIDKAALGTVAALAGGGGGRVAGAALKAGEKFASRAMPAATAAAKRAVQPIEGAFASGMRTAERAVGGVGKRIQQMTARQAAREGDAGRKVVQEGRSAAKTVQKAAPKSGASKTTVKVNNAKASASSGPKASRSTSASRTTRASSSKKVEPTDTAAGQRGSEPIDKPTPKTTPKTAPKKTAAADAVKSTIKDKLKKAGPMVAEATKAELAQRGVGHAIDAGKWAAGAGTAYLASRAGSRAGVSDSTRRAPDADTASNSTPSKVKRPPPNQISLNK